MTRHTKAADESTAPVPAGGTPGGLAREKVEQPSQGVNPSPAEYPQTPRMLFEVGGTRYGARVFELRHLYGHAIERRSAPNGSAVDEYRLVEAPEQLTLLGVAS